MFLMNTRPDICFVVNNLSQFLEDPRHAHLVARHAVRYLKGIVEYDMNQKTKLHGYVDSDWEDKDIDRNSTSGSCFSMRSCVISWFSRKESCIGAENN